MHWTRTIRYWKLSERLPGAHNLAIVSLILLEILITSILGGILDYFTGLGLAQVIGRSVFGSGIESAPMVIPIISVVVILLALGFNNLLAHTIAEYEVKAIIRGVRSTTNFEYEVQLAHLNWLLTYGVESLFFPPVEQWSYVSSTMIREIYLHNGDMSQLVPPVVLKALQEKRK